MTYAEKLKDRRWIAFRNEFFLWYCKVKIKRDYDIPCEACGEYAGSWHLHHKRYEDGLEPWEYSFDDVKLLCAECHSEIHKVEKMVRAWIIALKSNALYEFAAMMKILMEFKEPGHASAVARQSLYEFAERLQAQEDWENGKRTEL